MALACCKKCPSTTVQSCCGLRNLRAASLMIGFFKMLLFLSNIIGLITILSGQSKNADGSIAQKPTAELVFSLLIAVGFLFLAVVLIVGLFKKRRNYVMIYWVANWVMVVLLLFSLFLASLGVMHWILIFCYTVADIYFQIVIRSYYLEMTGAAAEPSQNAQHAAPANTRH